MEEHRRMRNYLRRMEREGVQRVKMFLVITAAYVIFWGPLFFVTLVHHPVIGNATGYEVSDLIAKRVTKLRTISEYKICVCVWTGDAAHCLCTRICEPRLVPRPASRSATRNVRRMLRMLRGTRSMDLRIDDQ